MEGETEGRAIDPCNERWARYWARRYGWALEGRGDLDEDDLAQAAMLGILRARESYRAGKANWASYSGWFIRLEIARALGIRRGALPPQPLSLDAPLAEDSDETLLDALADAAQPEPDAALIEDELCQTVRRAVARLENPRQRRSVTAVELEGHTLTQAAQSLGVSVERARQLIRAAHRRLRRDRQLQALAECELLTRYHAHMGVKAFLSSHTSVVERTVLWRLEQQDRILGNMADERNDDAREAREGERSIL